MTIQLDHDPLLLAGTAVEDPIVRDTVAAIARLLGAPVEAEPRDLRSFVALHLSCPPADTTVVTTTARGIDWPLVRVEIANRLADAPHAVLRDDCGTSAPGYDLVAVGVGEHVAAPDDLAAYLPSGQVFDFDCVLLVHWRAGAPRVELHVRRGDAGAARDALAELRTTARGAHNFYRGRTLRAVPLPDGSVELVPVESVRAARAEVVHSDRVWREIDTNVAGLLEHRDALVAAGLGAARGLLIAGPPGVGKTALSRVIAAELPPETTVVLVDPGIAPFGLARLYDWIEDLAPAAVFLDDIDLLAGNRRNRQAGPALGEFLTLLDGFRPAGAVLTVASTNVTEALDPALLRPGRFDSVVEVTSPDVDARERILRRFLDPICMLDARPVAARTDGLTGADLREIVRRAVLEHGTAITLEHLLEIARSGRWKPESPTGQYL